MAVPLVLSGPLCPAGISPPRGESPLSGEAFLSCKFLSTKLPRRGEQAAAAAVTLPFSHLKSGRKVSGDPPPAAPLAKVVEICYNRIRSDSVNGFQKKEVQKDA